MPYDLTPIQEYLRNEPPLEIAQALDEAMYDIILNAEQVGTTEGISHRYYTLRQLRDIIHNLSPAANGNPRD
ncbi:MAG: hypothetical protein HRT61_06075 [Ekhidna sp.]|nr:hypothetical protein [Ekhidna sp.]